jgi:hypothetical protein
MTISNEYIAGGGLGEGGGDGGGGGNGGGLGEGGGVGGGGADTVWIVALSLTLPYLRVADRVVW